MTPEQLQKEWKYEFEYWENNWQCKAVELIDSKDASENYEINKVSLFKLANGKLSVVYESGGSCYAASDADIQVFPTYYSAKDEYNRIIRENDMNKGV